MTSHKLTEEQKQKFKEDGYLIGLPSVFNKDQVKELNTGLKKLEALLEPDEELLSIRRWHMASRWIYDVCTTPQILDYVEDLLGPNFYMWSQQFFAKAPRSRDTVAWHQDAPYWPLSPHNSVTVWIAFTDVDEENGAMKVIPKTHKAGLLKHTQADDNSVLTMQLDKGFFHEEDAVSLVLKSGEVSIHDDALVHGSPANPSDRWRIGCTVRFSSTEVKCDLSVWPDFKAYLVRGVDEYNYNPKGIVPTQQFVRPERNTIKVDPGFRKRAY